jgi:hypothetical protein
MEAPMCNHNDFTRTPKRNSEVHREKRHQSALERLGSKNPKCIFCGADDPSILEKHHIAGRGFDRHTVIVCRNHHRKLSDLQKDHPQKIAEPPDVLEIIAHFLLGLADLFEFLIEKMREFAAQLLERADPNRDNLEPGQS